MKVWLGDLKEGNIFYHIMLNHIYKCKHLGDEHNMNFRMPRIKFEILDDENVPLKEVLGPDHSAFVNQYVYDDYESALEDLKVKLKNELDKIISLIEIHKKDIKTLEEHKESLEKLILKYER